MNEDNLNMQIRQYLKKVGITSQRTIEQAIQMQIGSGQLTGSEQFNIKMVLSIPELDINQEINGEIKLSK
ncbi:MAG: DUF6494 family protein [Gammaproteobacteria bacterium]|jgi:hypothetical protein|nr:DUF6494 family protein [Gammaproteobacteria bacterium]